VILYSDTSAVVKAILAETGTELVRDWFGQAEQVASSVITFAEALAALGRNDRLCGSGTVALRRQIAELDARWGEFLVLPVAERDAGAIALEHGLRGMDAVQLSAAVALRAAARQHAPDAAIVFASFDRRLLEAAEREGFATLGGPLE
jgi:predicted nucleic acid-binding protein